MVRICNIISVLKKFPEKHCAIWTDFLGGVKVFLPKIFINRTTEIFSSCVCWEIALLHLAIDCNKCQDCNNCVYWEIAFLPSAIDCNICQEALLFVHVFVFFLGRLILKMTQSARSRAFNACSVQYRRLLRFSAS